MAAPRFFRFSLMAVLAVAAAGAAYLGWLRRPAPPAEPLVVAVARNYLGLPVFVAQRQGFFAAEGLQVRLQSYAFGLPAFEAVLRGEAEVATVAETPLVLKSLAGQRFSIIANYMSSVGQGIVARGDRGIRQLKDLRGRRVGVAIGTTPHYVLHAMLSDIGLSEADVALVPMPGPKQAAALAAGEVDAVAAVPPYTTASQQALGSKAVVFAPGPRYVGTGSLAVARDFSRRRPEAALRLLRAIDRAIAWMRDHRQAAIALAAVELGSDRASIEASWDDLRPGLSLDQGFLLQLEAQARWATEARLVPGGTPPNYLDYIDPSVLGRLHPEAVTVIRGP